jgi:hypothetical protein
MCWCANVVLTVQDVEDEVDEDVSTDDDDVPDLDEAGECFWGVSTGVCSPRHMHTH